MLAWQPTGRKAQRHPLPSPPAADNAHSSTCLTAPPLCHTRIRSQSRRDAGWLLGCQQDCLSLPAVKPSATNKAISSNAALSNSNEGCGDIGEILAQNMSCLRLSLMRGLRHSGRPAVATAPLCLPSFCSLHVCETIKMMSAKMKRCTTVK